MKKKSYVVIQGEGIPCPRCKRSTQIRQHTRITEKHLNQPYFFSRWFYCTNKACPVTLHMSDEYKVRNNNSAAADLLRRERARQEADTSFIRLFE